MNKNGKARLKQLLKDSEVAIASVRDIKDTDVKHFHAKGRTKFVTFNWFKAMIENLVEENKKLRSRLDGRRK